MRFRYLTIFLVVIVQRAFCHDDVDTKDNPILKFLKLEHDSPHELVKIQVSERSKRETMPAGTRVRTRAFDEDIDLWLYRKESTVVTKDTPVYLSRYSPDSPGKVSFEKQHDVWNDVERILEDPVHRASLIIGKNPEGITTINGRIESKGLAIRYLPKNIVDEYSRHRRSINLTDDHYSDSMNHVVYKIDKDFEAKISIDAFNKTMLQNRVARSTAEVPAVIYPKVLVVADNSVFDAHGRDINAVLEYIAIFINDVDLKYRSLENPSVSFYIAGVIIGAEDRSTPYIADNAINSEAFYGNRAMEKAKKFFYLIKDSIPMSSYDISLTLTSLAFGLQSESKVYGKAWPSSVCNDHENAESMRAIAIIRDNGAFAGVHFAAHELGHVFGMEHDVQQSEDCDFTNGFLMSLFIVYTSNSSSFSECSIKDFQKEFDTHRNLSCMYKKPEGYSGRRLPRLLLPGRSKPLEEQCAIEKLGKPCYNPYLDVCLNFSCEDAEGQCIETGLPALEGTLCSDENDIMEKFCIQNKCVSV